MSGTGAGTIRERLVRLLHARGAALMAFIMAVMFLTSVVIRWPAMQRPLAGGHEWLTATVARTQTIWYEEGGVRHKFLPVMTYGRPADKYINNHGNIEDEDGHWYYISYPPLSYIAPYILFRAVGVAPSVLPLRVFNLGVHLLTALLIFGVVKAIVRPKEWYEYIGPLFAYGVYLFTRATLWYHSNVYMADMFVQLFFAGGIYLFFLYADRPASRSRVVKAMGVLVFFAVSTEWLAVFFAAALVGYLLLRPERKAHMPLIASTAAGGSLAVLAFLAHSSLVGGFGKVLGVLVQRATQRTGLDPSSTYHWGEQLFVRWGTMYYADMFGALAATAFLAAVLLGIRRFHRERAFTGGVWSRFLAAMVLSVIPVVLHHVIFMDFTGAHDFSTLKSVVPLSIAAGVISASIVRTSVFRGGGPVTLVALAGLVVVGSLAASEGVGMYRRAERVTRQEDYRNIGNYVGAAAPLREMVFLDTEVTIAFDPQAVYYAHRNIAQWTSEADADELMKKARVTTAMVYRLDERGLTMREYVRSDTLAGAQP